jgi:hypothetical protein
MWLAVIVPPSSHDQGMKCNASLTINLRRRRRLIHPRGLFEATDVLGVRTD